MKADELTVALTDASNDEFGDHSQEVYPSKYFNHGVFDTAPDGRTMPRNPDYCATNLGAHCLMKVLSADLELATTLVLNAASGWTDIASGGFRDSEPVPYIVLPVPAGRDGNPPAVNAGLLLDPFNHGNSGKVSLGRTLNSILDAYVAAGIYSQDEADQKMKAFAAGTITGLFN